MSVYFCIPTFISIYFCYRFLYFSFLWKTNPFLFFLPCLCLFYFDAFHSFIFLLLYSAVLVFLSFLYMQLKYSVDFHYPLFCVFFYHRWSMFFYSLILLGWYFLYYLSPFLFLFKLYFSSPLCGFLFCCLNFHMLFYFPSFIFIDFFYIYCLKVHFCS